MIWAWLLRLVYRDHQTISELAHRLVDVDAEERRNILAFERVRRGVT